MFISKTCRNHELVLDIGCHKMPNKWPLFPQIENKRRRRRKKLVKTAAATAKALKSNGGKKIGDRPFMSKHP